jgi:hypothetical protein
MGYVTGDEEVFKVYSWYLMATIQETPMQVKLEAGMTDLSCKYCIS